MTIWTSIIAFFARFFGQIHIPFSHKHMTYADVKEIEMTAEPGDILLSFTEGEASNLVIPGEWKHAAIYAGGGAVVEAIGSGIVRTGLVDFVMKKDDVAAFRPIFASREQRSEAALYAQSKIGQPYDYDFRSDNDAFYCSELVFASYDFAMDQKSPFKMRERCGIMTVIPDDIANADDKFQRLL